MTGAKNIIYLISMALIIASPITNAKRTVENLYESLCSGCHGQSMEGASASALDDGVWQFVTAERPVNKIIKLGLANEGMPSFDGLNDAEVHALTVLAAEKTYFKKKSKIKELTYPPINTPLSAGGETFLIERIFEGTGELWGLSVASDGSLWSTQQNGILWHFNKGKRNAITGIPKVRFYSQGGLMDVALDPDYPKQPWIYLSLSHSPDDKTGMTQIVRGQVKSGQWTNSQVIFAADKKHYSEMGYHNGSRFAFNDGYLFFSIGDRGVKDDAQNLSSPNGKIHRIHLDGKIPADNPFAKTKGAVKSIWSYGHRNPQGLTVSKAGELWQTEHGPRGGDELNLIYPGKNYGWPLHSLGINYDGTPYDSDFKSKSFAQALHQWTPSPGISSLVEYQGKYFKQWHGHFLVTSLGKQDFYLVKRDGHTILNSITIFEGYGRIRDVTVGPDGYIYLAINPGNRDLPGAIYRLVPTAH